MFESEGDEIDSGQLKDPEEIDDASLLFRGHRAHTGERGRQLRLVLSDAVRGGHDATSVWVVRRWIELPIRDGIEQPFVFEHDVTHQPIPDLARELG